MDDEAEPRRIEIELTPHDPTGGPLRGGGGRTDTPASGDGTEPPRGLLTTERGRLVAVGAFAAVTALLLGVLVGRLGSGDIGSSADDVSTSSPTSIEVTTTRARNGSDTLPRAPEVLVAPATTQPVRTTVEPSDETGGEGDDEGDPSRLVDGRIVIDRAVPISEVEVVALTGRGEVARIDVATGATVTTTVEGGQYGPPSIYAGDGWILVPSYDERLGSTVIFDDGSRSSLATGAGWPLMANVASGTFWLTETEPGGGAPTRLVEIGVDGSETGLTIELSGFYPQMIDPLGGVVVQAPGGHYVMTGESVTRVTGGRLLALGARVAVVQECGESLDCGYSVIDRASGERTLLDLDPTLTAGNVSIDAGGWWEFVDPMSPSEDALVVTVWLPDNGGRQSLGVIDLVTGGYEEIAEFVDTPLTRWAPDGRSVYWMDRGRLKVFDRTTGDSVLFAEELGAVNAFTLRPVSTSAAEERGAADAFGGRPVRP